MLVRRGEEEHLFTADAVIMKSVWRFLNIAQLYHLWTCTQRIAYLTTQTLVHLWQLSFYSQQQEMKPT